MRTLAVKLPQEIDLRLDRAAKGRGMTKSALVRAAVLRLLDQEDVVAGSAGHLAQDLAGAVKGPTDLSTNSRHLKGFGR